MKSVYLSDGYTNIWAKYDKATPLKLYLESNTGVFEVSLLLKEIPNSNCYYEAYTPYGYGGPILIEGDHNNIEFPYNKFLDVLREKNIVNAFIRFSPFLNNQNYLPNSVVQLDRYTVSRRLSKGKADELLKGFSKGTKWAIKKSFTNGVEVLIINGNQVTKNDSNNFYKLYRQNMEFVNAADYYFLNEECICNHFTFLGNNIDLFVAKLNNQWIASALFLKDDSFCHYHLSAADRVYSKCYPIERILFEAFLYYGNQGLTFAHLGGGLTLSKEDSLFKFKSKFANEINEFYIGKIIVNNRLYQDFRHKNGIQNSKMFLINDALECQK